MRKAKGTAMIQARHNTLYMDSLLECEQCTIALRNALRRSSLSVTAERSLDDEIQRELGMRVRRCVLFTVWDPMQLYRAMLIDERASLAASLNIVVSESESGSRIAAQTEWVSENSSDTFSMKFMVQSITAEVMRVLEDVAGQKQSTLNRGWSTRIMRRLRKPEKQLW